MSRVRATLGVTAFVMLAICACGLEPHGQLDNAASGASGGSGATGTGGTSVGGGTCFPDSKVCKDPESGQPICFDADTPETGCSLSTACDPCVTQHGTPKCENGACAIAECESGHRDCNGVAADGCESISAQDPLNCGDCGIDCSQGAPNQICKDGVCTINDCIPPTTIDCDLEPTNGCEVDSTTDPNNCLFCGNVCEIPNAASTCENQKCVLGQCNGGWSNCDNDPANGCETHTDADSANCGTCKYKCPTQNSAAQCENGACKVVCTAGFADCDSTPGCEASTKTVAHCGGCNACTPNNVGAAKCPNGACGYDSCKAGFGDCDGDTSNGCEAPLKTDNNNCGSCGNGCGQGQNCSNSQCICSSGFDCGAGACQECCKDQDCGGSGKKCCGNACHQGPCP